MIALLLLWILLAPVAAWIIGAGIRLSEQRRLLVADETADEGSCPEVEELVATG